MRKLNYLWGAALLVMLFSCDTKDVKLYPSMSESADVYIHHQGDYDLTAVYNVLEVKNTIDDLDAEGSVTDVMIEGLHLDISLDVLDDYPITTAESTTGDLMITGWDGIDYMLAQNVTIDLTKGDQQFNLYDYLDNEGVTQLRDILFDIATNNVPEGETNVSVTLSGVTNAIGAYLNAKVVIVIDLTLEFTPES